MRAYRPRSEIHNRGNTWSPSAQHLHWRNFRLQKRCQLDILAVPGPVMQRDSEQFHSVRLSYSSMRQLHFGDAELLLQQHVQLTAICLYLAKVADFQQSTQRFDPLPEKWQVLSGLLPDAVCWQLDPQLEVEFVLHDLRLVVSTSFFHFQFLAYSLLQHQLCLSLNPLNLGIPLLICTSQPLSVLTLHLLRSISETVLQLEHARLNASSNQRSNHILQLLGVY